LARRRAPGLGPCPSARRDPRRPRPRPRASASAAARRSRFDTRRRHITR
jgi:hypothetical protein